MVCLKSSMAADPERTSAKPLHNFGPPWLRWGSQRYLRCMKLRSAPAGPTDSRSDGFRLADAAPIVHRNGSEPEPETERKRQKLGFFGSPRDTETGKEEGIAAMREKLLIDLEEAVAKIKDAILVEERADVAPADDLRPCKARTHPPPTEKPKPVFETPPAAKKRDEPVKLAVSLSREEIEADFRAVLGHRPPRRPKKRGRVVQQNLDSLFPGLLLHDISAERYKVPGNIES